MIARLRPLIEVWRGLARPGLVRLALLDIDGCVTGGEASWLDFPVLQRLQELNLAATRDAAVPALTLCTGRQEPYVEVMVQAIGGYLPAIWENGCGLYVPADYRFALHPLLDGPRLSALDEARRIVAESLIRPGLAYAQPGKEVSITLYATERSSQDEVEGLATVATAGISEHFWVKRSVTTVEILPRGIDKGSGLEWMLAELGVAPGESLAIGDSPSDADMFRVAGLGAAPANAHPELQAAASYVSALSTGEGLLDILDWCVERNRAVLRQS